MAAIYDASGGVIKTVEIDETDKKIFFGYSQDTEPYFNRNKRMQTECDGYTPSREMRRVASVPFVTLFKWLKEDGITQLRYMRMSKGERKAWLMRKIYDPNNWFVLTAPRWSKRYMQVKSWQ